MSSSKPWIDASADGESGPEPPYPLLRRASGSQPESPTPEVGSEEDAGARPDVGTIEVIVRLTGGDAVLVGRFGDFEDAKDCARGLVESLREDEKEWPVVNGRFLRPAAIVSIDINEHGPKWTGSSDRASSWAARERRGT